MPTETKNMGRRRRRARSGIASSVGLPWLELALRPSPLPAKKARRGANETSNSFGSAENATPIADGIDGEAGNQLRARAALGRVMHDPGG